MASSQELSIPGGRLGIGNVTSQNPGLAQGLGLTLSSPLGILVLAHLSPTSTQSVVVTLGFQPTA